MGKIHSVKFVKIFIKAMDPKDYRKYFLLSNDVNNELLSVLKLYITKKDKLAVRCKQDQQMKD